MKKVMILVLFLLMTCTAAAAEDAVPANAFQHVPTAYMGNSPADSRVERVTYTAKTAQGLEYVKSALVYLPAGYDDNPDARYDILYLMHGGGENETTFLGGEGLEKPLKHMLDNMISAGKIPPVIVCCPNYRVLYCDETKSTQNFPHELRNHLMPLVESRYRTHAVTADDAGFRASREHRAFSGFSMGAAATWRVFETCMDYIANFAPISGDCWSVSGSAQRKAQYLADRVTAQGFTAEDFRIYAGCGNKSDVAYGNLTPQIEAMKQLDMFPWAESFADSNLYYAINPSSGHTHATVYAMVYNSLQHFFGE